MSEYLIDSYTRWGRYLFCLTRVREEWKVSWKDAPVRQCCPVVRTCGARFWMFLVIDRQGCKNCASLSPVSREMRVILPQRMSENSHRCCSHTCFVPPPGTPLELQKLGLTHLSSCAEQSQNSKALHRPRCYCRRRAHRAVCGCQEKKQMWEALLTP